MEDTDDILLAIRTDAERGARLMVARYRTRLEAEARAFGVDAHTAEDLVFRTFERAIERIDTCRSADSFYAWLSAILRNFHLQMVRTQAFKRMVVTDSPPESTDTESTNRLGQGLDAETLRKSIDSLPKEMREAILMHYFMDIPVARIAKILSIPEGTVKSRLHYARIYLGGLLQTPAARAIGKSCLVLLAAAGLLLGIHLMRPSGRVMRQEIWLGDGLQLVCPGRRLGAIQGLSADIYLCSDRLCKQRIRPSIVNDGAVLMAPCEVSTPSGTFTANLLLVQIGEDIWGRVATPRLNASVAPLTAEKPSTEGVFGVRLLDLECSPNPPAWRMNGSFATVAGGGVLK